MHVCIPSLPSNLNYTLSNIKRSQSKMSRYMVPWRMQQAHPIIFTPQTFFFTTSEGVDESNWAKCFGLKAAAVYSAIFGRDADELPVAEKFLKCIAFYCLNPVQKEASVWSPEKFHGFRTVFLLREIMLDLITFIPSSIGIRARISLRPMTNNEGMSKNFINGDTGIHDLAERMKAIEAFQGESQLTMQGMKAALDRLGNSYLSNYVPPPMVAPPPVKPEPTISIATLVEELPTKLPIEIKETCDAIYIVVVFLKDLNQWAEEDRQKMDSYVMSKHGSHLVSDIALLQNQLLLDHTINVVQNLDQAVIETLKFMSKERMGPSPSIIYLKLPFNREDFHELISLFCWYYSPFYAEKKKFHSRLAKELITKSTLLECLHYCLERPTKDDQAVVTTNRVWSIPTAKELAWSGVRFEADPDGAIQVQFVEPVFKLPALVFDTKIETVVSNLMALESSKLQRPLTRYFQLMNELVDDEEDVRVLKRFGVVRGRWKREGDVVDFVKRVCSFVSYPTMYPSVEDEIGKMRKWHDERSGKFLVRSGWALRSASVAAVASIVATAIFAAKRRG